MSDEAVFETIEEVNKHISHVEESTCVKYISYRVDKRFNDQGKLASKLKRVTDITMRQTFHRMDKCDASCWRFFSTKYGDERNPSGR